MFICGTFCAAPFRLQQVRENLQAVEDSWSGAVEVGIAVDGIDPAVAHGGEVGPLLRGGECQAVGY